MVTNLWQQSLDIIVNMQDQASQKLKWFGENVNKQAKSFSNKTKEMAQTMERSWRQMRNVWGAVFGAISWAVASTTTKVWNYADEILDAADKTGLSTDRLQEYRYAAEQVGIETDTLESSMESFTRRLRDVEEGTWQAGEAFESLWIATKDNEWNFRQQGELFEDTIEKLADMEDQTERNTMLTELFGRRWLELAPLLEEWSEGIEEMTEKANELWLVMGEDSLDAADEFRKEWDQINTQIKQVWSEIWLALIPVMRNAIDTIQPVIANVQNWISDNHELIESLTKMWGAISWVVAAMWTAITVVRPLSAAIWALMSPLWLVVGAVTALAIAWREDFMGIQDFTQWIVDSIRSIFWAFTGDVENEWTEFAQSIMDTARNAFETIREVATTIFDALQSFWKEWGDDIMNVFDSALNFVVTVFDRAFSVITAIVKPALTILQTAIQWWIDLITEIRNQRGDEITTIFEETMNIIQSIFDTFSAILKWDWEAAWNSIVDIFNSIWTILFDAVYEIFSDIMSRLWNFFLDLAKDFLDWGWDLVNKLREWLANAISGLWEWFDWLRDDFRNWFNDLGVNFISWWEDLVRNLIDWIRNIGWEIRSAIMDFVPSPWEIRDAVTDFWWWMQERMDSMIESWAGMMGVGPEARAEGWPVKRNSPYIVGEEWPELFVPNISWEIISNDEMKNAEWSWWERNVTVNINMWWVNVNNEADEKRMTRKIEEIIINTFNKWQLGI